MKLDFKKYRIFLKHSFGISRSENNWYDIIFVYLNKGNLIGRGEAAPSIRYKESINIIEEILSKGIRFPENCSDYDLIWGVIYPQLNGIKSLEAALSMALLDLISQQRKKSVIDFLNLKKIKTHQTSFTIAIGEIRDIPKKIKEAEPYKILKVKLGSKGQDKNIIKEIREHTDKKIRVDANEGWTFDQAVELCNWLVDYNVELIEQPFPAKQLSETKKLKQLTPLDIYADENCCNSKDIKDIKSSFDGINIKLMKCGSILEALKMIQIAKNNNLKVMLGCMIETSVGITAVAQLAGEVDIIDLDGNLLIQNDPYSGADVVNGSLILNTEKGLGLSLRNPTEGLR